MRSSRADVVFCLDVSGSMKPCIDAVREHIDSFVKGLSAGGQYNWDVRFGLNAHRANDIDGGIVAQFQFLRGGGLEHLYTDPQHLDVKMFFTKDVGEFRARLGMLDVEGDEAPLLALDVSLDFPWRPDADCHRVIVLLTDEPPEDGAFIEQSLGRVGEVIDKAQNLGVELFIVGPDSDTFDQLSQADKSEYEVVDIEGDGLAHADFSKLLMSMGRSVSASLIGRRREVKVGRALFGQDEWSEASDHEFHGG